jgi:uracil-DNA glycosylase family 4
LKALGLLFAENAGGGDFKTKAESAWLQELGCKACPLNPTPGKIEATGSAKPEVYVLGEAAGGQEEEERKQFVGKAGQLLRGLLPKGATDLIRWNNILGCHPPKNRSPLPQEVACCRPRVVKDIAQHKPRVIWGFGNVPLTWVSGFSGINNWRGRRMPVKIGDTTYWYYAFLHPSFLSRVARDNREDFGSEDERMTWLDLRRAYAELDELPRPVVHTPEMAKANVECITDINHIAKALQWAARLPTVGWDYETNRLRPYEEGARILSVGVGTLEKAYSFPIHHPGAGYTKKQIAEVEELCRRFLVGAACKKRVHNLAFELEWSGHKFGIETIRARPWEDTANMAVILDERTGRKIKDGPMSLVFLCQQRFGFNLKKISNVDRAKLESTPLSTVLLYNGMDAKYHDGLGDELSADIERVGLQEANRLAQRRVPTVVLSQLKGVPVDQAMVNKLFKKYDKKVKDCERVIQELPVVKRFIRQRGREFNPFSTAKDLPIVLDEMLGLSEVWVTDKFTKKEKFTTEETALDAVIQNHPEESDAVQLAKALIELRAASGTKVKYVDSLMIGSDNCVVYPDGLVHTNFNTFFVETGRLSSDDPNLQNFPKRDEGTKEVRRSVAAGPGEIILAFDYGQIEARVVAMFTHDKTFVKALWDRWDVHADWAKRLACAYPSRVGGKKFISDKKVMKDFRTDIKNQWTFPLFFGATAHSVSGYLKMPQDIIEEQIEEFWKMFPDTKAWQDGLVEFYNRNGYVECMTGRRRRGPMTINQLINAPVQGTAAEIVLDAMSRLSEKEDPETQPEINIHDDLTFLRVRTERAEAVAEKVIYTMLTVPFKWAHVVPITVEMSMGKNWCDLEELKDDEGKTTSVYSSDQWQRDV